MSNLNQKIVLFISTAFCACQKPSKIGNLFMNRFAIDEDAENEILKIYQLEDTFYKFCGGEFNTREVGLDLINHRIACDS